MPCGIERACSEVLLRLLTIGLSGGAIIALNAIGVTLVYGVVRTINFAYGDLFALATVLASSLVLIFSLTPDTAPWFLIGGLVIITIISAGSGALLNIAVERIAFRPFRGRSKVAPLIAGIGLSFMLYQGALLARYVTNFYLPGEHRSVPGIPEVPRLNLPPLLPRLDVVAALGLPLGITISLKDLLIPLLATVVAGGVGLFLGTTKAGRALRACAQDPEMAQLCGINQTLAISGAFALGGGLAGLAAVVHALYYTGPFTLYGAQSGLFAFTAAVLGGIGRPSGAFVSGLLLGILAALSDYFLAAQWTPVLLLGLLILLLLVRPQGLAGDETSVEEASATDILVRRPTQPLADSAGTATMGERIYHYIRRLGVGGPLLVLAVVYPWLDQVLDLRLLVIVTSMLILALLALGLNLLLGSAGILDLGYAACFGLGAYTAGLLTPSSGRLTTLVPLPDEFLVLLILAALVGGLFGALNTALTMRLRGEYLAIVTLAFGQLVPRVVLNLDRWTGGARGIAALPPPRIFGIALQTPTARYYLALTLALLVALGCHRLVASRIGRAWAAISADELAATSCGVSIGYARYLAFVVAAAIAGAAGALFARTFSYVDPGQSEFRVSAMILAMVVIGGAGSASGAILGALLVAGYDLIAIPLLGAWLEEAARAAGGTLPYALDPRALNFLAFGLALYITVFVRAGKLPWKR